MKKTSFRQYLDKKCLLPLFRIAEKIDFYENEGIQPLQNQRFSAAVCLYSQLKTLFQKFTPNVNSS